MDEFRNEILPVARAVNNTTIAHILNPCNYEKDTNNKTVVKYFLVPTKEGQKDLETECWDSLIAETESLVKDYIALTETDKEVAEILQGAASATLRTELEIYKVCVKNAAIDIMEEDDLKNFDFLTFLKSCNAECSNLMVGIRACLCIPVSAAGPERLFSDTGRTITTDRNRLDPWTVSKHVRSRSFLQNPPKEMMSWTG